MVMNEQSIDSILLLLEGAGLRTTRPRTAIIQQVIAWGKEGTDFSAEMLWHELQQVTPWLGRATVFRTVDVLADLGVLDRVTFADGTERYHTIQAGTHHHHLTCDCCHRVVDLNLCIEPQTLKQVEDESGFTLSGHRFEIFGRCPDCRKLPQ